LANCDIRARYDGGSLFIRGEGYAGHGGNDRHDCQAES
jgi:hypothetical protein